MRNSTLTQAGVVVAALMLAGTDQIEAQECQECSQDSPIEWPVCEEVDWDEMGSTTCEDFGPDCETGPLNCWGDDPGLVGAGSIRIDGSIIAPQLARSADLIPVTGASFPVTAESFGFSADARLHVRNCRGLITARVYGGAVRSALVRRTEKLVL
jgi:hypothetical protein